MSPGSLFCLATSSISLIAHGKVKTIKVHHLVPHHDKVIDELLLPIRTRIDLSQCAELGVRAKDKVHSGSGPLAFARLPIAAFKDVRLMRQRFPLRAHVEQIHKEGVGQRLWSFGEHTVRRLPRVGIQDTQPADEHRHFGRGQR